MSDRNSDAKALRPAEKLANAHNWKHLARWNGEGFYELETEDTNDVRVRLFFTPQLLEAAEEILYRQIVNATRFHGVRMVVITPDAHYGYGVPVGCVPVVDGSSRPIGELAESGKELLVYALSAEHKVVVAKAIAKKTRPSAPLVK